MNCNTYKGYKLAEDLFQFTDYLKSLEKFCKALHQAKQHRKVVLPYLDNRHFIDV
jgi:hypothetical protein